MALERSQGLDKEAFVRRLLAAGRGAASRLAAKGGRTGRVGRFLQRPVRSPVSVGKSGPGAATARVRSPLGAGPKAPAGKPAPSGAPYRAPAAGAPVPKATKDATRGKSQVAARRAQQQTAQEAEITKRVGKRKGLVQTLLPGALLGGVGYGLYKGVPAAVNFASTASNRPMAPGLGYQSYGWGFDPQQAAF